VIHPILVCTYTNVAVDNLVEGFVNAGLNPVRIGYGQIKSASQEHSLEFKIGKHPLYQMYEATSKKLKVLEKESKEIRARISERRGKRAPPHELSRLKISLDILRARLSKLHSKEHAIYQQMQTEVLVGADVVSFSAFYICDELMEIGRYAPLVSVLGPGRWVPWIFLWSSWMRLRCPRNLLP